MKVARLALAVCTLGVLAGCPADPENPPRLWVFLQGSETDVMLIDHEPPPH
jgi:hypothetical protein